MLKKGKYIFISQLCNTSMLYVCTYTMYTIVPMYNMYIIVYARILHTARRTRFSRKSHFTDT